MDGTDFYADSHVNMVAPVCVIALRSPSVGSIVVVILQVRLDSDCA